MKLLRTIRLDPSDTFIFERAAESGEWAISGSFLFLDGDTADLNTKQRHALRSGFLGIGSLGFSTLATVSEATAEDYAAAREQLAQAFVATFGAPGLDVGREAAEEELQNSKSLCDHPVGTLVAVERTLRPDGGIAERFRTLRPRERDENQDALHAFARAFTFHEIEDDSRPEDEVDLLTLNKDSSK